MMPSKKLCHGMRRLHSWAVPLVALPLFVIIVTGIVLLVRREIDTIHPLTRQGSQRGISLSLVEIERIVGAAYPDEIKSLADVKELRILPAKGVTKIRLKDWREVQIDSHSGAILHVGTRWSSVLIGLHEGSFFSTAVSYIVYLPASLLLLVLWVSGVILFWGKKRWKRSPPPRPGIGTM